MLYDEYPDTALKGVRSLVLDEALTMVGRISKYQSKLVKEHEGTRDIPHISILYKNTRACGVCLRDRNVIVVEGVVTSYSDGGNDIVIVEGAVTS